MKRTENSQTFFYIKQLLCLLQVGRLGRVVELNGLMLSKEEVHKELQDELADLRRNFVVPSLTIKSDYSVVNLKQAYDRLLSAKLSARDGYHPALDKAVKETPNLIGLTQEYKEKFEHEGGCKDVRDDITSLINFSDSLFKALYDFIEYKESTLYFEQAINYVNILACVEFFFSLAEMGKAGFEPEEETEDNPWVD